MQKEILYQYIGTNGTILSPIHLEDIYYIRKVHLVAGEGKQLTKDGINMVTSIIIPEEELDDWHEVDGQK